MMIDDLAKDCEAFFFEAMQQGWVAGTDPVKSPTLPGFLDIPYEQGDFRLVDSFCVGNDGRSVGSTTIWYKKVPAWRMQYGGDYPDALEWLVQEVLSITYRQSLFIGGRGPYTHTTADGLLTYVNITEANYFIRFRGREQIVDTVKHEIVGWHEYSGLYLL